MTTARRIVAAHALWMVLSRPFLPGLLLWPEEFWSGARAGTALRFVWMLPMPVEWALYGLLAVLLALVVAGVAPRIASVGAAILLYHFAPLEDAFIGAPGPYMRGLTGDVLALAMAGFAPPAAGWTLPMIRFTVAAPYFLSTVAKLQLVGLSWFAGPSVRDTAATLNLIRDVRYAESVMTSPALATFIGALWFAVTVGMIFAPFSRRAAAVVVPAAAIAHLAAIPLFGVIWLGTPLLLVFLPFAQKNDTENASAQSASA